MTMFTLWNKQKSCTKQQNTECHAGHLAPELSNTRVLAVYTDALKHFLDKSGNKVTFLVYYIYFKTFY